MRELESAVLVRYGDGSRRREESLCCPVDYDPRYLSIIPDEVIERDYGCGDPSAHLAAGETVLDLGSGSGKICYIAAQVVGPSGRVIGVDFNPEMLTLARRHQPTVAARLGYDNVDFRRGKIQDLRTDLDAVDALLREDPVASAAQLQQFETRIAAVRAERPLVADASVDVVVSNCVLNLVHDDEKRALLAEIHRVLRRGGRAVISDIVADELVPEALKQDPELWSGCISGAFQEKEFVDAFAEAGFYGVEILERSPEPWRTVGGIEFRSLTVRAWKGKDGPCWEHNQAVVYRGPWSEVRDDDGHVLRRGEPTAVCAKTFAIYTQAPYAEQIVAVPPRVAINADEAVAFDCGRDRVRAPRETKGEVYAVSSNGTACAVDGGCC